MLAFINTHGAWDSCCWWTSRGFCFFAYNHSSEWKTHKSILAISFISLNTLNVKGWSWWKWSEEVKKGKVKFSPCLSFCLWKYERNLEAFKSLTGFLLSQSIQISTFNPPGSISADVLKRGRKIVGVKTHFQPDEVVGGCLMFWCAGNKSVWKDLWVSR